MASSRAQDEHVARWAREIRKGSTRLALLALLAQEESYGYQIVTRLKERDLDTLSTTEAAVYPLLHDLEKGGHLVADWRATDPGVPPRKYYRLTSAGLQLLDALRGRWAAYRDQIDQLLGAPNAPDGSPQADQEDGMEA